MDEKKVMICRSRPPALLILALMALFSTSCHTAAVYTPYTGQAAGVYPGEHWPKASTPEQLGWSSPKLARARAYAERIGSAAVMIVDDGVVVDAWGEVTRNFGCHSMRKSLLSALIGLHVAEGGLNLSKTLAELGIDDLEPSLSPLEKRATMDDLIKARSGVYHPALGESRSMKAERPARHSHAPGTFWYYNNWDFNALGTIFGQETGQGIFEDFEERIARPLQMEDFSVQNCRYRTAADYQGRWNAAESTHRYYLFRMSARDLARFGLLFLRRGRWQERQIITAPWVAQSTAAHSQIGPDKGYGYMWWTGVREGLFPFVRVKEHSYCAAGYGGHRLIILPYRKLVVVHRVDTDQPRRSVDQGRIGRLLWLILDAAGEKGIGAAPLIEAAQGIRLTEESFGQLLGKARRVYTEAGGQIKSYFQDGTMTAREAGSGRLTDQGRWWFEGPNFCLQWRNASHGQKICYLLVVDEEFIKVFDLHGDLIDKFGYRLD